MIGLPLKILIVLGINFPGVIGNCFWDQVPGCKGNLSLSFCNCSHLQRCQMPDIENSRKSSRKGCRVGQGKTAEKQPEEQPKHPKNSCFECFSGVSAVLPAVFWLVYSDPLGTLFGCFFGCFQCRAFGTSVDGRRDCNSLSLSLSLYFFFFFFSLSLSLYFFFFFVFFSLSLSLSVSLIPCSQNPSLGITFTLRRLHLHS